MYIPSKKYHGQVQGASDSFIQEAFGPTHIPVHKAVASLLQKK